MISNIESIPMMEMWNNVDMSQNKQSSGIMIMFPFNPQEMGSGIKLPTILEAFTKQPLATLTESRMRMDAWDDDDDDEDDEDEDDDGDDDDDDDVEDDEDEDEEDDDDDDN